MFHALNGETLEAPDDEAYDLVIDVANAGVDLEAIADQLGAWHYPKAQTTVTPRMSASTGASSTAWS